MGEKNKTLSLEKGSDCVTGGETEGERERRGGDGRRERERDGNQCQAGSLEGRPIFLIR